MTEQEDIVVVIGDVLTRLLPAAQKLGAKLGWEGDDAVLIYRLGADSKALPSIRNLALCWSKLVRVMATNKRNKNVAIAALAGYRLGRADEAGKEKLKRVEGGSTRAQKYKTAGAELVSEVDYLCCKEQLPKEKAFRRIAIAKDMPVKRVHDTYYNNYKGIKKK